MSESDARRLLGWYDIPLPSYRAVATADEAVRAAEEIGLPVAVKGVVRDLLHKTEEGAVVLGLATAGEVKRACEAMADRLAGRLDGFVVEQMAPAGLDLLVGVVRDSTFGPVVSLGFGGTLVEVLKTVEFRLVPVSAEGARDLVADERLGLTGKGLRSLRVTRPEELERVLMAVAGPRGLFAEAGELLGQFEINPLRVTPTGLVALDVKAVLGSQA